MLRVAVVGEYFECQRLQRIPGEDGHRFAEGHMAGGPAAAQLIIVHRRQIVVDQGVGVDQLHRTGRRIQRRPRVAAKLAAGVDQQRAQAFASAEHGMAHRLMKQLRGRVGTRQHLLERALRPLDQRFE